MKHSFQVLERNYRAKFGEIDIIAKKDGKMRFIEVKSVKVRDLQNTDYLSVTPSDNLTYRKWSKFTITVENYLKHKGITLPWQIDLACVYIDPSIRQGKVVLLENILKE
jgi:putative endonuclease